MTKATGKGRGYQKYSPEERFWMKVDKNGPIPTSCPQLGPCWIWTGCKSDFGHGTIRIDWKLYRAHRLSFEWAGNLITKEDYVLHKCDNPPCVNPLHLFKGTKKDNTADMYAKGRNRENPPKGKNHGNSKLTDEDVLNIRKIYRKSSKEFNQYRLAEMYGVTQPAIKSIILRQTWKHI